MERGVFSDRALVDFDDLAETLRVEEALKGKAVGGGAFQARLLAANSHGHGGLQKIAHEGGTCPRRRCRTPR